MTELSTREKALNGDRIYGLKISHNDHRNRGRRTLAKRENAVEFDIAEIVETYVHPVHPGINVIFLHEARRYETLEVARARNPHPQEFLISKVGRNAIIASSCMGYRETSSVTTYREPDLVIKNRDVHYMDYAVNDLHGDGRPDLVTRHFASLRAFGGDPDLALPQATADRAFRYLIAGAVETP